MKQTIRINERELHRMISESVKRVLMEGKVVNNKPYFRRFHRFDPDKIDYYLPGHQFPGDYHPDWNHNETLASINGMDNGMSHKDAVEKFRSDVDKHNQRAETRRLNSISDNQFLTMKGDREDLLQMLHDYGVSVKKYNSLSPKEQRELIDKITHADDFYYLALHKNA